MYYQWSLLIDNADAMFDDGASDYGSTAIANYSEADAEHVGLQLWNKDETAADMKKRWVTQILDVNNVMLDICH